MKIRQVIPSAITSLNLVSGSLAIIFAFRGDIDTAALLVVLSSVFDFFDGFAARILKAVSEFGKQLDSLADLISFGFAPTAIFYNLFLIKNDNETSLAFFALLLVLFAALRLAKFNIDSEQKNEFKGLPTPAMALFIISISYFCFNNNSSFAEFLLSPYSFVTINIVLSVLMVSNIKLMSLKVSTFKLKEIAWQMILILGGLILLTIFKILGIGLAIILYIALSFLKQIFDNYKNSNKMKFIAQINVMPLKALLDPQGKAVISSASKTGFQTISSVRIGKHIDVELEAKDKAEAANIVDELCKTILSNPIIESYEFNIFEIK